MGLELQNGLLKRVALIVLYSISVKYICQLFETFLNDSHFLFFSLMPKRIASTNKTVAATSKRAKPVAKQATTAKPDAKPAVVKPAEPDVSVAVSEPAVSKPTAKSASRKAKPATAKPKAKSATVKPKTKPATAKPDAKLAKVKPDAKPATVKLKAKPATVKPKTKPATAKPDAKPAKAKPDAKPAKAKPEAKPAKAKPAKAKPDAKPATKKTRATAAKAVVEPVDDEYSEHNSVKVESGSEYSDDSAGSIDYYENDPFYITSDISEEEEEEVLGDDTDDVEEEGDEDKEEEDDDDEEEDIDGGANSSLLSEIQKTMVSVQVLTSVSAIHKKLTMHAKAKFYPKLKVVHMQDNYIERRRCKTVEMYLCDINRHETKKSCQKIAEILQFNGDEKFMILSKLMKVTIWHTNMKELQKKVKIMDIVLIRRADGASNYYDTPQLSCHLSAVEVCN